MRHLIWLALLLLLPSAGAAQELSLSLGEGGSISARTIQLILLITVLSLAPGLAIMITCFPFLITVLAILRQGDRVAAIAAQHADRQSGPVSDLFHHGAGVF
ncbi:flagellar biosynthetic protein FliP [Rhodobacteraceae bacterium KLH11]|nr:flagellar biosynthetic protein FliP [Rhodobacteraceae bacterium KLH11]